MRELENHIILKCLELEQENLSRKEEWQKQKELLDLFTILLEDPLGKMTPEFVYDDVLQKFAAGWVCTKEISFRLLIEKYLLAPNLDLKQEYFSEIEAKMEEIRQKTFKSNGQGLLPKDINRSLIINIYLSDNQELIELFCKNLPIPRAEIFAGDLVPQFIEKRTEQTNIAILNFLDERSLQKIDYFKEIESKIINIQRKFRAQRRQREEMVRIAGHPCMFGANSEMVAAALTEANRPYKPQKCSPALADRITTAAKKVKLFSTIHHFTSEKYLSNIFNDCLYGRRNLLQNYIPFKPAALNHSDLEFDGGDANVICFAPKYIDPNAIQEDSIDLEFDLEKMQFNPSVFYKQRDLGYDPSKYRKVEIDEKNTILFSHTKLLRLRGRGLITGHTNLQIFEEDRYGYNYFTAYSELPNFYFIAYNVKDMHQILTLNFFRFLDELYNPNTGELYETKIAEIYKAIDQLNEKDLLEFLTNLGQNMTDTAEFNIYGSYKIDFSALNSTYFKKYHYKLDLKDFIKEMQQGDQEKLQEVLKNVPVIFESYRFIDYILKEVTNPILHTTLLNLRQLAFEKAPEWMKQIYKITCETKKETLQPLMLEQEIKSHVCRPLCKPY